jgi:hypothetical protein
MDDGIPNIILFRALAFTMSVRLHREGSAQDLSEKTLRE